MHAIILTETGGPEVLTWCEWPDPVFGPGEVLIDVAATGVNFRDIYFRQGMYPADYPFTPGLEAAGTVSAVGAGVSGLQVGDPVVAYMKQGAYAERVAVDANNVALVPAGLDHRQAAALLLQGLTAHSIATSCVSLRPGDWVVIHAAAGGLGLLLTQIVKHLGCNVIGTVSNEAKAAAAREAGADVIAGYEDFVDVARANTAEAGVRAVFDGVGANTFRRSIDALDPRGTLVLFGWVSGPVAAVPLDIMLSRTFVRPRLSEYVSGGEFARRMAELFSWTQQGVLKIRIGAVFPMSRAGEAQEALESRAITGKVLIVPDRHCA